MLRIIDQSQETKLLTQKTLQISIMFRVYIIGRNLPMLLEILGMKKQGS
jgi:hypothetical protein